MLQKTEVVINSVDINGIVTPAKVYAETYTEGDYTVPAAPYLDGQTFEGWKVNDTLYATADEVLRAVETLVKAKTTVTVAVSYKKNPGIFSVTVNGGKIDGSVTSEDFQVSTLVKVIADTAEGKKFSHWKRNGVVISYNASYSFFMPSENVSLTAVFVDDTTDVEEVGIAMIESVTPNISAGKVSFVSYYYRRANNKNDERKQTTMKKKYVTPEMESTVFDVEDVIEISNMVEDGGGD